MYGWPIPHHLPQYLEIRYEDLVLHPEKVMRTVVSFINEEWEDEVAVFKGKQEDYEVLLNAIGRSSRVLKKLQKPLNQDRLGVFRTELSETEMQQIHTAVDRLGMLPYMLQIETETSQYLA